MLLLLLACVTRNPPAEDLGPFHDGVPAISGVQWSCDSDEAEWTFRLRTDAWTNGGHLWLGRGGDDIEKHAIYSKKAAADGSWDCLELSLDEVADWRDAASGSSTRWRCSDAPELTAQVRVYAPKTGDFADCRTWGADPSMWAETDEVEDCDEILTFDPDTGDTDTGAGLVTGGGDVEACN